MKQRFAGTCVVLAALVLSGGCCTASGRTAGARTTIYVYLNFGPDPSFPSITSQRDTLGLGRFTGAPFNLPSALRDALVNQIVARVREDYQAFSNVVFVTDTAGLDWWYTWGIDDSGYVFDTGVPPDGEPNPDILPIDPYSPCPDEAFGVCARLYGKAGIYADIDETDVQGKTIFHPMHARTFAGSFALGQGCAARSEPALLWGELITGTGKSVDLERLANALGNSASHEIAHMFGARDEGTGVTIMNAQIEKREAFYNKSFSANRMGVLTATLTEAATADAFEPSDLPLGAAELPNGNYPNLTLHSPFDEDFYRVTTTETDSAVRLSFSVDRTTYGGAYVPLMNHWMNVDIRYQDGQSAPWVWANHRVSDNGYLYEEWGVPAGRTYQIHVFQFAPRQPMKYGLQVSVGKYACPPPPDEYDADIDTDLDGTPDVMNDNDSPAEATVWSSGCDFSGDLTIHDDADVDWYQLEALGYSVEATVFFDPAHGDLELFLDNVQATTSTLSSDGTRKTLTITGCGQSPSRAKVQGDAHYYSLCFQKIPLQEACEGYEPWVPFVGSGTFHFRRSSPWVPDEVVERDVPVNRQMFAKLVEIRPDVTIWRLCGSVDYGGGYNQLFTGNLRVPPTLSADPVPFVPVNPANPYILPEATPGRVAWYLVPPVGHGEGTRQGLHSAITGFDVTCSGLQWHENMPDDLATLVFRARIDTDTDLVPDEVEVATGTDPSSDDSDGDGLLDGTEDADQDGVLDPGETDPRLLDTDGDGLSDGVESGLTAPEGNDTNAATFRADSDPSTTTDPTNPDTDGDGLLDGEEDANHNGRLDPGESSPLIRP